MHALSAKSKNIFHAVSRKSESWGNFELASTKSSQAHFSSKMYKKSSVFLVILDILYNFVGEIIYFNPVNDIQTIQNKISVTSGKIVMYQPDETIRLEVRLGEDTVWLSQQQIAMLFGVKQPAISKHLNNIFRSGELNEASVHSILEYTASDGKRYQTKFYNLDAILSVGYRVNSINATLFRQWANKVLKDYLLKGYSVNKRFEQLEQRVIRTPFTLMRDLSPAMLTEHLGKL